MPNESRIVSPGPAQRTVYLDGGTVLQVPKDWELLAPGDAGLTRRVKSRGPTWTVKQQKGRRTFSLGVWAPADRIIEVRKELEQERSTEKYAKSKLAAAKRRESKQAAYVEDFHGAVVSFLDFEKRYVELANRLAEAVTKHATPVGSGTVARTERIPIERRAESAVIAWMRHQTTAYDRMAIPRARGMRREVRRMLAEQSRLLLRGYRSGKAIDADKCPLQQSLSESSLD